MGINSHVRLTGLTTAALNGAKGRVVGMLDASTGRWPIKFSCPAEVVAEYPDGAKIKPGERPEWLRL